MIVVLLVGGPFGCAGSANAPSEPSETGFAAGDAVNVFKVGYAALTERFIEPLDISAVALDGMRGLSDLDPSLAVGRVGDAVHLTASGRPAISLGAPSDRDADGWAKLTVRMLRQARQASPRIAAASAEALYEAVFDRIAASVDINGRYATAAEARRNRQRRDGYTGIGLAIGVDDGEARIVEITGRGPAERAGLRVGDVLVSIDGQPVTGLDAEQIEKQLQDDVSGWVRLTVRRPERGVLRFVVLKAYLIPETVREWYNDGILYVSVQHFNQGTADRLAGTLQSLATTLPSRVHGIVLDLRGNPGGLLQQAIRVSDLFLNDGAILATRGRHPDSVQDYTATGGDLSHGLPLVILVDGNTASAAELVAAALQDRGRALLVGSSTYGKGTVQTVVPLPNGGELSLTWSRAVPPSGADLSVRGVRPAVCTSGLYVVDPDLMARLEVTDSPMLAPADALGCPAEPRDTPVDAEVARRMLSDSRIYARLLRGETVVAGIPNQRLP